MLCLPLHSDVCFDIYQFISQINKNKICSKTFDLEKPCGFFRQEGTIIIRHRSWQRHKYSEKWY